MPFPFVLPTTSHLVFQLSLQCSTHPSLPSAATSHRTLLRTALKEHKRLPDSAQATNLRNIHSALSSYLPYLFAIDSALSGKPIAGEEIDIALISEIEVEWRPMLSAAIVPKRDATRVKGRGLDYEIYFVLSAFANIQSLLARDSLRRLYASTVPTKDQRLGLIQDATRALSAAQSVHSYLQNRSHNSSDGPPVFPAAAMDVLPSMQSALQSYAIAETTLLYVLKDDPYPALLVQSRNKSDKEWMIKAPEIAKVRAHLLARLCLSAAEHGSRTVSTLKSDRGKVSKEFLGYSESLRDTSRAKACRFLAIDADIGGETGKAIAWLQAGMNELGFDITTTGSKSGGGLSKLKASLIEQREERWIEKGFGKWAGDAGKAEEGRIIDWLERKWSKMNDTMNIQVVPDWRELVKTMPSGRDVPGASAWTPVFLDEDELVKMRAPPDPNALDEDESSGDEEAQVGSRPNNTPGGFPDAGEQSGSYY